MDYSPESLTNHPRILRAYPSPQSQKRSYETMNEAIPPSAPMDDTMRSFQERYYASYGHPDQIRASASTPTPTPRVKSIKRSPVTQNVWKLPGRRGSTTPTLTNTYMNTTSGIAAPTSSKPVSKRRKIHQGYDQVPMNQVSSAPITAFQGYQDNYPFANNTSSPMNSVGYQNEAFAYNQNIPIPNQHIMNTYEATNPTPNLDYEILNNQTVEEEALKYASTNDFMTNPFAVHEAVNPFETVTTPEQNASFFYGPSTPARITGPNPYNKEARATWNWLNHPYTLPSPPPSELRRKSGKDFPFPPCPGILLTQEEAARIKAALAARAGEAKSKQIQEHGDGMIVHHANMMGHGENYYMNLEPAAVLTEATRGHQDTQEPIHEQSNDLPVVFEVEEIDENQTTTPEIIDMENMTDAEVAALFEPVTDNTESIPIDKVLSNTTISVEEPTSASLSEESSESVHQDNSPDTGPYRDLSELSSDEFLNYSLSLSDSDSVQQQQDGAEVSLMDISEQKLLALMAGTY